MNIVIKYLNMHTSCSSLYVESLIYNINKIHCPDYLRKNKNVHVDLNDLSESVQSTQFSIESTLETQKVDPPPPPKVAHSLIFAYPSFKFSNLLLVLHNCEENYVFFLSESVQSTQS